MPTNKRRIALCLPPDLDEMLRAIAKAGRVSQAGVVLQVLEAAAPTLERMARGFRAIQDAVAEERAVRLAAIDREAAQAVPMVQQAQLALDAVLGELDAAAAASAEAGAARSDEVAEAAPAPRPVITGVTLREAGGRKQGRKPGKGLSKPRKAGA